MKLFSKIIGMALASAVLVTGCSKEFLEEPKPATAVAATDVFASEAGVRSFLTGMYRNLRIQWGSATDAWGIVSVNLAREAKGIDISLPLAGFYNFDYLHDNREPTYRRTVFTWDYFYSVINASNNLIAGVRASSLSDNAKAQ